MNASLRRRLERAVRVRDFIRAHRTDGAGEATALTRLEDLVQRADVLSAQQRAGVVATRAATLQRAELRHLLQSKLLMYLAAVGAVAAKGNTELAPQFHLPPQGTNNQAFVTAVRGMLQQATAQKDLLVSRGMSPQLVDDLTAALAKSSRPSRRRVLAGATTWGRAPISNRFSPRSPSRCGCSTGWCAIGSATTPS
jgi:hypothetical protein